MSIIPGMDIIDNEVKKSVQNIENFIDLVSIEQAIKELSKLANDLLLFAEVIIMKRDFLDQKNLTNALLIFGAYHPRINTKQKICRIV